MPPRRKRGAKSTRSTVGEEPAPKRRRRIHCSGAESAEDDSTEETSSAPGAETNLQDGASEQQGTHLDGDNDDDQTKKQQEKQKQKPKKASTKGQAHETMFVRNLKACIKNKELLRANRRGLVPLNDDQDKPTFSLDELHRNRKRGLSYKAIAKKIGIDTSKEDVLAVSRVLEADSSLPTIESISTPYRRSLPSPLWFMWDSELEVIKKSALPSTSAVMSQNPHVRILKQLGEDAGWLLHTYCLVQNVVHSELRNCFEYASDTSPLGELDKWTNALPSSLVDQVLKIEKEIANAACQMTKEHISSQGRCRCGAITSLKFKWKSHPIQYPSFFWGCVKYTSYDRALHDSAKSQAGTVWAILSEVGMSLLPTDARHLYTKCSTLLGEVETAKDFIEIDQFNKVYGGPSESLPAKGVDDVLSSLRDLLTAIDSFIPEEAEKDHPLLN